ncbi:MAG: hypothetical protein WBE26_18465 [Phycisphaerae bacterium]
MSTQRACPTSVRGASTSFPRRAVRLCAPALLVGLVATAYRVRMEQADHSGEVQPVEIIDEAHIFQDPEPITLNNPRIRLGSIVVKGDDRVTLYQPERDYTVHRIGNRVEIRRVVTGWIPDQQRIYIDYIYSLGGSFGLDTLSQNFGIRQDFDIGLVPYYRFEWQDQTVSPAEVTEILPEDITAHIVGLEYQRRWLRLTAEYEDRDSTIDSFEKTRLGAILHHRYKSGATGNLHAHWSDTDHHMPTKRNVRLTTIQGQYRHPITANLDVEGSLLYRIGEDSLSGDDDGIDLSLSVDWSIRQVEVKIMLDLSQYEDDFARNESSALYVQVRRSF